MSRTEQDDDGGLSLGARSWGLNRDTEKPCTLPAEHLQQHPTEKYKTLKFQGHDP